MRKVESHVVTLADSGIESVEAAIAVGDDIKGKVTFTTKDANKAKELAKTLEGGIERAINNGAKENVPEATTMVEVLKSIKSSPKEEKIVMEGHAGAEAIQAFLSFAFVGRASAPVRAVPPPCPE